MSYEGGRSESAVNALKDEVLESQVDFLNEELGDPGRYLPQLRAKGILSLSDCQMIRSKVTFKEKVEALVNTMKGKVSTKNEHSFDVLVDSLKKQRVQAHIAKVLQKALAKAKENVPISSGIRSEKRIKEKQHEVRVTAAEHDKNHSYHYHPEHGQLPLPPASASVPSMDSCSYDASDEDGEHPVFGKLPARCGTADNMVVYTVPQSTPWMGNSEFLETSSESEPGGQSLFTKSSYLSDGVSGSFTTPTGSLSDSSSSSANQEDSIEVLKLKAMVQDLKERLQEAHNKIDEKNVTIHELEKKLLQHQYRRSKEEEERMFSKDSCRTVEATHPHGSKPTSGQYQVHGSRPLPYRTTPSIPASSPGALQHRGPETVAYNNYINYSRNTGTSASVSTV